MIKKIRFFLLGEKGFQSLSGIDKKHHLLILDVIIGEDKKIQKDCSAEIADFCQQHNITHYKRSDDFDNSFEIGVAIGWKWLIKDNLKNLYIIHDSILPKYRGFNPLVSALINKESYIGATCIKASNKFDTGNIIFQEKTKIEYPIKIREAIGIISSLYVVILDNFLSALHKNKKLHEKIQDENMATYSVWRDNEDYRINWNDEANSIGRFIDSVGYPYQGAISSINGKDIIINDYEVVKDVYVENRSAGKVLFKDGNYPVIICGNGLLKLTSISDLNGEPIDFPKNFRYRLK